VSPVSIIIIHWVASLLLLLPLLPLLLLLACPTVTDGSFV
jgi:hypothetical protein